MGVLACGCAWLSTITNASSRFGSISSIAIESINARGGGELRKSSINAQKMLEEVFEVTDRAWRGVGTIPKSGWRLSPAYRDFDAEYRFEVSGIETKESPLCRAGEVLQGALKPNQCEAFGKQCTPRNPLGATMVSAEGACAAYYNYGRFVTLEKASQPVHA